MVGASTDRERLATHFSGAHALRVRVITLSDRAARGEYEDLGGPRIQERLEHHLGDTFVYSINREIFPDDAARLQEALESARDSGVHVVFTTGGTGLGPRDIAPDVVLKLADRTIPGIMEHIRLKYGAEKPLALLSRSVVAVIGSTLVYTLPGSPRAVDEYLDEILKTLDHLLCVIYDLRPH
ncbi:MAG: MogA/MoaB family molybdenum cofactor biosynthesis protein [Candidatus Hydrogenedentota bacterium]